jgi:hypothetical protein
MPIVVMVTSEFDGPKMICKPESGREDFERCKTELGNTSVRLLALSPSNDAYLQNTSHRVPEYLGTPEQVQARDLQREAVTAFQSDVLPALMQMIALEISKLRAQSVAALAHRVSKWHSTFSDYCFAFIFIYTYFLFCLSSSMVLTVPHL